MGYVALRRRGLLLVMGMVLLAGAGTSLGEWQIQEITALPMGGTARPFVGAPTMAFDSQDRPHVAYMLSTTVSSHYRSGSGTAGSWTPPAFPIYISSGWANLHFAAAPGGLYLTGASNWGGGIFSILFDGTSWGLPQTPTSLFMASVSGMATDRSGHVYWIITNPSTSSSASTGYNLTPLPEPQVPIQSQLIVSMLPVYAMSTQKDYILQSDGDMVFDAAGNLHTIQFCSMGNTGTLFYATGPVSGPFSVDDTFERGWWVPTGKPSIAVDIANTPHMVYTTLWPYYRLNYLTREGTGWKRQTIDGGGKYNGFVGTFPKILIDGSGTVHVIYADGRRGLLKHARLVNNQWQIETIDTIAPQANCSEQTGAMAAAMDSQGGIGVVYWDADDGKVKYAYLAP